MKTVHVQKPAQPAPQQVRIIGGVYKRTPLPVPALLGLRPTPSRVRETLFNWLGQDMSGLHCLDAFAGSGALGLEAASRGASQVLMLEQNAQLVQGLQRVVAHLGAEGVVQVRRADAHAALAQLPPCQFDVVFLDPPFLQDQPSQNDVQIDRVLSLVRPLLKPQAVVYLETPRPWLAADLTPRGWQLLQQNKAGAVHYALLAALGTFN